MKLLSSLLLFAAVLVGQDRLSFMQFNSTPFGSHPILGPASPLPTRWYVLVFASGVEVDVESIRFSVEFIREGKTETETAVVFGSERTSGQDTFAALLDLGGKVTVRRITGGYLQRARTEDRVYDEAVARLGVVAVGWEATTKTTTGVTTGIVPINTGTHGVTRETPIESVEVKCEPDKP
jgi:hypothetical protein